MATTKEKQANAIRNIVSPADQEKLAPVLAQAMQEKTYDGKIQVTMTGSEKVDVWVNGNPHSFQLANECIDTIQHYSVAKAGSGVPGSPLDYTDNTLGHEAAADCIDKTHAAEGNQQGADLSM